MRCWCLPLLLAVGLMGCASNRPGLPPSFSAAPSSPRYARQINKLQREGQRNWVLNLNELAVSAMRNGDHAIARQALDEAILQIEVIYGDDPRARRARSLFYSENSKIFKGDPHERSMTFFYRGVIYMQDKEWDNARACFRSAIIMDAFAEDSQYRGDWALFDYLIGVCDIQLNRISQAADAFELAQESYQQFRGGYPAIRTSSSKGNASDYPLMEELLPFSEATNLLVLTQHGKGPRKIAAGNQGELLTYAPGDGRRDEVLVAVNGTVLGAPQITDSVTYQAMTRGGRELDAILGRQAFFKSATGTVGDVGILAGSIILIDGLGDNNSDQAWVGAGVLAAGAVASGLSALAQPQADTRTWRTLPDALGLLPIRNPAGDATIEVKFANETALTTVYLPEPGNGLVVVLVFPPPAPTLLAPPGDETLITEPLQLTLN
jgi:tetratricopeptide (TPR) repeat protein